MLIQRVLAAAGVATLVLLAACAHRPTPSPQKTLAASAEGTSAVAGTWVPADSHMVPDLVRVILGPDGAAHVVSMSSGVGPRGSGSVGGRWHVSGRRLVFLEKSLGTENGVPVPSASATYSYFRQGDGLTLTWLNGTPPGTVSAGPSHFAVAESDSWITGSRAPVTFILQR
jgi:hypothetical protein